MLPLPPLALPPLCSFSKHHTLVHTYERLWAVDHHGLQGSLDLTEAKQWAVKWGCNQNRLETNTQNLHVRKFDFKLGNLRFSFIEFGQCLVQLIFDQGPVYFRFSGFFKIKLEVLVFVKKWSSGSSKFHFMQVWCSEYLGFVFVPSLIV